MKSARKFIIAGNWKMNKNASEAEELFKQIEEEVGEQALVTVAVYPPFTAIDRIGQTISQSSILLGAQNMHPADSGAYTGEVSAEMLRHLYVTTVLIGHSERRTLFGETDDFINQKVLASLKSNLRPVLCVGETLEEREADQTLAVVEKQIRGGLAGIKADKSEELVIAYEPVWAIGTGKVASPEQAQEVHAAIRGMLANLFGAAKAEKIRILYGGSMKPDNADELLSQKDIDGGLIGGAALTARSFCAIVQSALKLSA
jgi:triosephosphate isomerase